MIEALSFMINYLNIFFWNHSLIQALWGVWYLVLLGVCSPDLAVYDFWIFPLLKSYLQRQKFETDDKIANTVDHGLHGLLIVIRN